MASVDWIRLSTSLFDNPKIKVIETYPKGDSLVSFWIRLLCLAGRVNNQGLVYIAEGVPYTPEMLAAVSGKPEALVKQALALFQQLGMVAIDEKGVIEILGWSKHQNVEGLDKIKEQTKERVRRYRNGKRNVTEKNDVTLHDGNGNAECNVTVTLRNATDKNRIDKNRIDNYHYLSDDDNGNAECNVTRNEIFPLWEKNISPLNQLIADRLVALLEEVGEAAVEQGIIAAVEHGARNFSYVQTVAKNYASGNGKKTSQGKGCGGMDLANALYGSEGDGANGKATVSADHS